jgi:hypothetical protein
MLHCSFSRIQSKDLYSLGAHLCPPLSGMEGLDAALLLFFAAGFWSAGG